MAKSVSFDKPLVLEPVPKKFEAGTMPFAEITSPGTLTDYLNKPGMHKSSGYEVELMEYGKTGRGGVLSVTPGELLLAHENPLLICTAETPRLTLHDPLARMKTLVVIVADTYTSGNRESSFIIYIHKSCLSF
jgi:aminotransferase class V